MRRLLVYAGVMLTACVSSAMAQPPGSSPEEVVRQFFKAEDDGRWLDAARLLDLKRFEAFRQMSLKGLRTIRAPWRRTAEEIMQWDPEMPRAVAEYQAKQANKGIAEFDLLGSQFARVASADSLEALPVDEAAARWLEAQGPKWQEERDRKRTAMRPRIKCPISLDSVTRLAMAEFKPPTAVILGATTDGDSVRYVVVGRNFGRPRPQEVEVGMSPNVMTLVRVNGAWRIMPTHDMVSSTGFGSSTTFSVACEMEKPAKDSRNKK